MGFYKNVILISWHY